MAGNKLALLAKRGGELDIRCVANGAQVELCVDGDHEGGPLRVRLHDESGRVVVERLVRAVPGSIRFPMPGPGRYAVAIEPLCRPAGERPGALTWRDWNDMMRPGLHDRSRPHEAGSSEAVLLVA